MSKSWIRMSYTSLVVNGWITSNECSNAKTVSFSQLSWYKKKKKPIKQKLEKNSGGVREWGLGRVRGTWVLLNLDPNVRVRETWSSLTFANPASPPRDRNRVLQLMYSVVRWTICIVVLLSKLFSISSNSVHVVNIWV